MHAADELLVAQVVRVADEPLRICLASKLCFALRVASKLFFNFVFVFKSAFLSGGFPVRRILRGGLPFRRARARARPGGLVAVAQDEIIHPPGLEP